MYVCNLHGLVNIVHDVSVAKPLVTLNRERIADVIDYKNGSKGQVTK